MNSLRTFLPRYIAGGLAILALGLMAACGNNNESASSDQNPTLIIYNGQHKEASIQLEKEFTEKTGIKVESREGSSNELAHQIVEEGDKSPADLIYTEETTPLIMLQGKDMLAPAGAGALANVPQLYADPKGQFVPLTIRPRTVVYNPSLVQESDLPKSLFDFLTPEWKDKFGFVPTSGAFQQQLSAIIKLDGKDKAKEFLEGLKSYGKAYGGNKDALNAVESGEVATAFINNYYWDRLAREKGAENLHSKLYYFGTKDVGDMFTFSGMAILKSSKHLEAAQQFLEFMTGKEAQQVLTDSSMQYPVNAEVTNANLRPFSELTPPDGSFDLGEYGDGNAAIELLQEAGLL